MALLELNLYNEEGKKELVVKDRITGLNVKKTLQFVAELEEGDLEPEEMLDEAVKLLVEVFDNEKVTYDTIMNDLAFDGDKGFINTILEQLYIITSGKKGAQVVMQQLMNQQ